MARRVVPALTPTEWRTRRVTRTDPFRVGVVVMEEDGIGVMARLDSDIAAVYIDGEARRALAALALADREYGFTLKDVRLVRRVAAVLGRLGTTAHRLSAPMTSIADRLAALVPPEPDTDPTN